MLAVKVIAVLTLAAASFGSATNDRGATIRRSMNSDAALITAASPLGERASIAGPRVGRASASLTKAERLAILKKATCSTYPCPAGYFWYYFDDPYCPGHPDTFNAYVEYWNSDASFNYDAYAGHATYNCNGYQGSTVGSSWQYQNCVANSPWNCNDLGYTWNCHPVDGCSMNKLLKSEE